MNLELLANQSAETQKEQLGIAKGKVEQGLDSLNYEEFRQGVSLFKKFAQPAFTSENKLALEREFFEKLEVQLAEHGIVRNKPKPKFPGEHSLRYEPIVFSLEGMALFKIYPNQTGHEVYSFYQEAKPLMPGYEKRVSQLELQIAEMELEVLVAEKLIENPLYLFTKDFKKVEAEWLGKYQPSGDAISNFKKLLNIGRVLKGKNDVEAVLESKRNNIQSFKEVLANVKENEEKNRYHDEHLESIKERAEVILEPYHLFGH